MTHYHRIGHIEIDWRLSWDKERGDWKREGKGEEWWVRTGRQGEGGEGEEDGDDGEDDCVDNIGDDDEN